MTQLIDFSNRQNRFLSLTDVSTQYLHMIESKTKQDPYYPTYHVAPHHGLLNDPNGLSYFNGKHHIFYQWFPLGPVHGLKHWYHVSTEDFVHFEDHGIALYPDCEFDSHGCFSGAAFAEGGMLHLFYTGNHVTEERIPNPSQVYASMDKHLNITKGSPITDEPAPGFTHNFRDPVVFKRENIYYMLVGGETKEGEGALALYQGESMHQLSFQGKVTTDLPDAGYMWECPNYFEQDGRGVFIFSPQGELETDKYNFNNVFSVAYVLSDPLDVQKLHYEGKQYIELDKGFDFYAPQTYEDERGRRILIGWLGNSKSDYPTDENMWAHMLTIPREITLQNNRLVQQPLEELKKLRLDAATLEQEHGLSSRAFELEVSVEPDFSLTFSNRKGESVTFSSNGEEYCLDRSHMTHTFAETYGTKRYALRKYKESHHIRMFIDSSSLEIFCDYGETVFTSRIFIEELEYLNSEGVSGTLYNLKSMTLEAHHG
ncbi:glycoside hydrolase family 32 protein [Halobacillus halophilus]|uniref:glycoside hydrolase family 32 protein n=1 Tax=Halobacillus halophilus TaxID=1570 RepID=UPI001CD6EC0C|nr:sucrose-6-phosphate hydrolase [Halobacillus halophilus]MCA1011288.1 sucrose-6-phosphate hydrolase [Halobacillus halophilus]